MSASYDSWLEAGGGVSLEEAAAYAEYVEEYERSLDEADVEEYFERRAVEEAAAASFDPFLEEAEQLADEREAALERRVA